MTTTKSLGSGPVTVPAGAGPFPGIVVLSEAWGINAEVERLATRLVEGGFAVALPDLVSKRRARGAIVDALRGKGRAFDQIEETTASLASDPRCGSERIGVLGISLGATLALRLAVEGRYRAVAAFYGLAPRSVDWSQSCPVVASFAGRDRLVRDWGLRLADALGRAGVPNDIKCYGQASHSFLTEAKPGLRSPLLGLRHDPGAAADAWHRTISFLDRHLQPIPA